RWHRLAPEPVVVGFRYRPWRPVRGEERTERLLPRPLPGLVQERGIDTVLIAGTVTQVCCESSARDAFTLGYRVVIVADANATGRDQDHNASLATIYRSFGDVRSTAEILAMVGAPNP
ncbi:isochorismatase family protein, partial [Streptomyces violascens]|uniref:isochorismatase family protein n=1 Tax=Streptomyces violascens TaxID=67381 RepID=UPI003675339A